ncbi:hypothetical protein [Dermabacter hominis]
MPTSDRISFDVNTSQAVQGDLAGIIGRLEGLIAQRDQQVATAEIQCSCQKNWHQ